MKIKRLSKNTIEIIDGSIHYIGAANFRAKAVGSEIEVRSDIDNTTYTAPFDQIEVDGKIHTSVTNAVVELNLFIGGFKPSGGSVNSQEGDTITGITSNTTGDDVVLLLKTDKNIAGFETTISDVVNPKSGFLIRWNVTGLNVTINNGNVYNIIQHLVGLSPALSVGVTDADFPRVNTGANALLKFPANAKLTSYMSDVRLTGSMTSSSDRTFTLQLRRSDNSLVKGDTFTKSGGTALTSESNNIFTYTNGINDPYTIGGLKMEINNTSSSNITLTGFELIIDGTIKNY